MNALGFMLAGYLLPLSGSVPPPREVCGEGQSWQADPNWLGSHCVTTSDGAVDVFGILLVLRLLYALSMMGSKRS